MAKKKNRSGIWIMVVAALALEAISCIQYFSSRSAIRETVDKRAEAELRNAEQEIEIHTIEVETAAKTLALLVQEHLNQPDRIAEDTRLVVRSLENTTSLAVAFKPGYFPKEGRYFELCSSRLTASKEWSQVKNDSIYTRQIGSAEHDYTKMEWYQNGLRRDSCWWSEPYQDDAGSKAWVVSCSCPVYDSCDSVVAVVCIDLSLDYLQSISEHLQIIPGSYSSIRSNKGENIVPIPDTISGKKYNIYNAEIRATGWHIEIIIPEEALFADLNHIGRIVGVLMLLGLIILALMLVHSSKTTQKLIRSTEQNQRMEGELHIARAIQMAMLPKVFPPFQDLTNVSMHGIVQPAKEVGGDLYDFYLRHNKLFFCIGDVSGKGVPAALVMAMTRSLFRTVTSHEEDPAAIMNEMNRSLSEQNTSNMFLTLFIGVLDTKTGKLDYCNAGHNAPMVKANGEWRMVDVVPNLPLGIEGSFVFQAQQMQLAMNDVLFLYTDGLTEAENGKHEQFGEERMMERLMANGEWANGESPLEMVTRMQASVEAFREGAEPSDDLTMLAVHYHTPALIMRNDIQQIPTLSEWIDSLGIPAELSMPINLALEEIVSNVMLYAYPGKSGQVIVESRKSKVESGEQLIFTVTDSGIAFDPTQKEEVDTTLSAEERPIGGLGIHLVRQIMDEVHYERIEDKNILTLIKNI